MTVLMSLCMQREGRIVLSTDVHWRHPLVGLQGVEELYAEFVHLDVAALQVSLLPFDRFFGH